MAVFFAWSNSTTLFVVGNGSLLDYQNLPADYEGKFKNNEWNAMCVKGSHTGPNGYHWVLTNNLNWSARCPNDMVPWLQPQLITVGADSLAHGGRGRATFVAFAPNGVSWFIRSDPKQCIWGPDIATFPVTWQSIIANLEANHPRKDECIDFVAFGVYDLLLVRFENGNAAMYLPDDPAMRHKFSAELIKEVQDRLAAGWTIGNRTALCAFDTNRWFIEWKRGTMAKFRYSTVLGDGPKENEGCERISNVLRGVGNNAGLVASNQNAQLIAANSAFMQQLALSKIL